MKVKSIITFDIWMFIAMVTLMIIGTMFIYSSGVTSTGLVFSSEYIYQIVWIITGLVLYFLVMFSDYLRIRRWSFYLYAGFLVILILTLFIGKSVNGSRSWLGVFGFGVQPSEFAKIATILFLSDYFVRRQKSIKELSTFIIAMVIAFLPVVFIIAQPDMGTSLVYIPVFLVISVMAGVRKRYAAFFLFSGLLMIFLGMLPAWGKYILKEDIPIVKILVNNDLFLITGAAICLIALLSFIGFIFSKRMYFYWVMYSFLIFITGLAGSFGLRTFLKEYQIMRLIVFLDPGVDPRGTGWNIIQSLTAVGSGGVQGKGFLAGTQSHYRFLPQQSTDFIFSILAEESGFIGSVVVLVLFGIILIRGLLLVLKAKDLYGFYVGSGIVMMIFFHLIVNIGMAIGIMPITGIPLLFISYGGSSLWTALIAVGLIQNIYIRRFKYTNL